MSDNIQTQSRDLEFVSPLDNPDMKCGLAEKYAGAGDFATAETLYREVIARFPGHYGARMGLGDMFLAMDRVDDAIVEYENAARLNPDNPTAYVSMGAAFIQKGEFDTAVNECEEALFIDPHHAPALKNLTWAYLEKGDYDMCLRVGKVLLGIEPESGLAHNNVAVAWFFKKDFAKALEHMNKALSCGYPVSPDFYSDLRSAMENMGGNG